MRTLGDIVAESCRVFDKVVGRTSRVFGNIASTGSNPAPPSPTVEQINNGLRKPRWARILKKHGALAYLEGQQRPFVWLWEMNDLVGLKPYLPYSWEVFASFFTFNGHPVKPNMRSNQAFATDWMQPKTLPGDDCLPAREVNLPAIIIEMSLLVE